MPKTLLEAYADAQAYKNDTASDWSPTADDLRQITERLTAELGGAINPRAVEETVRGMGWVGRMVIEYGLNFEELMVVSDAMLEGTWGEIKNARIVFTPEQACQAGIGAGLYTGLLIGLRMKDGGDGAT